MIQVFNTENWSLFSLMQSKLSGPFLHIEMYLLREAETAYQVSFEAISEV